MAEKPGFSSLFLLDKINVSEAKDAARARPARTTWASTTASSNPRCEKWQTLRMAMNAHIPVSCTLMAPSPPYYCLALLEGLKDTRTKETRQFTDTTEAQVFRQPSNLDFSPSSSQSEPGCLSLPRPLDVTEVEHEEHPHQIFHFISDYPAFPLPQSDTCVRGRPPVCTMVLLASKLLAAAHAFSLIILCLHACLTAAASHPVTTGSGLSCYLATDSVHSSDITQRVPDADVNKSIAVLPQSIIEWHTRDDPLGGSLVFSFVTMLCPHNSGGDHGACASPQYSRRLALRCDVALSCPSGTGTNVPTLPQPLLASSAVELTVLHQCQSRAQRWIVAHTLRWATTAWRWTSAPPAMVPQSFPGHDLAVSRFAEYKPHGDTTALPEAALLLLQWHGNRSSEEGHLVELHYTDRASPGTGTTSPTPAVSTFVAAAPWLPSVERSSLTSLCFGEPRRSGRHAAGGVGVALWFDHRRNQSLLHTFVVEPSPFTLHHGRTTLLYAADSDSFSQAEPFLLPTCGLSQRFVFDTCTVRPDEGSVRAVRIRVMARALSAIRRAAGAADGGEIDWAPCGVAAFEGTVVFPTGGGRPTSSPLRLVRQRLNAQTEAQRSRTGIMSHRCRWAMSAWWSRGTTLALTQRFCAWFSLTPWDLGLIATVALPLCVLATAALGYATLAVSQRTRSLMCSPASRPS